MAGFQLLAIPSFLAAVVITVVAIRVLGPLAHRFGWLDRPLGRKDHSVATPFTGGLAMLFTVLVTLPVLPLAADTFIAFGGAFVLLIAVGTLDDLYGLSWKTRLLAQVCAGLLMIYFGGLRIDSIGPTTDATSISLGALSVPFTLLIVVGMINAMNMVDGVDGAAGCVALASLILLASVCALTGNGALLDRIVLFMGVTTGFLIMNLRHPWQSRAQVFLGNSGSTIIGFALAWLVVRISQSTTFSYSTLFSPWFMALPVIDAVVVVVRRLRHLQSPFRAGRDHLHHLLLDAGYAPTSVALLLGGASLLLGLLALFAARRQMPAVDQIALFAILTALHYLLTRDRDRALRVLRRWGGDERHETGDAKHSAD